MYQALYRKWRPQVFSDVVGQEHITKTLMSEITSGRHSHAYLFTGSRGTGKTTCAKIFAKAVNCEHPVNGDPCNECETCKGIDNGSILDVIEIDAASNNGVDNIRDIRDEANFTPVNGRYRVYIIDEVHMLSNAAFNALLKTLEEPPKHVIFILATTEPYKLPNTILSRCQRFDFQSISIDDILTRLKIVAEEENIKINEDALNQIASSAEGGMRDALSLFDQCISYSVNPEITLDDVLAVSGNISYLKIIEILNACASKNETEAVILLDKMLKEGKEVPRVINDIILFLRDVLLYKNQVILENKLMFNTQEFKSLASNISKNLIYSWLEILNDSLNQMRFSTQKRAFLELAILKMNDNNLNSEVNLLDRIESLESTIQMLSSRDFTPVNSSLKSFTPVLPTRSEMDSYRQVPKPVNNTPVQNTVIIPDDTDYSEPTVVEPNPSVIPEPVNVATKPIQANTSNEVTVRDIEAILNNASKEKKEKLTAVWGEISERYSNTFAIQILVNGKIVAVSDESFLVELADVSFCNRVMLYENYVKIIEILNEFDLNIKDYICVPKAVWSKIRDDYKNKYQSGIKKPTLDEIPVGVKKRIVPTQIIKNEDEQFIENVKEFFDDNQLKIVEE